jgi:hypothetical protein
MEWSNWQDHMVEKLWLKPCVWFVDLQKTVSVPDAPKEEGQGKK